MKTQKRALIAEAAGSSLAYSLSAFQRATTPVWPNGLPTQDGSYAKTLTNRQIKKRRLGLGVKAPFATGKQGLICD